jgi:L-fucose isomerase-like protein
MRRLTVGAIGARTTAFKTVRFDELALQRHGITTETLDLADLLRRVRAVSPDAARAKRERLRAYADWPQVPEAALDTLARLGAALDEVIAEFRLDALALRCWLELEQELRVSPCVLLSEINDRLVPAACELDVCSAVAMTALRLASQRPAACLDWNNNYGDEEDKCILFHCGPVPQALMAARGRVIDHPMFAKALGPGCGYGCNVGRIAPAPLTYAGAKTEGGGLQLYLGEGAITDDPIPDDFFGCAGVARIEGLQRKLDGIGHAGYRHHVAVTTGHVGAAVREACGRYLGYAITDP